MPQLSDLLIEGTRLYNLACAERTEASARNALVFYEKLVGGLPADEVELALDISQRTLEMREWVK
jgi:hypothetical protein